MAVAPLDYAYSGTEPTWNHSIVLPPILTALKDVPAGGMILDIGCGNGAMLAEIRRHGDWSLFGIESAESGAAIAREQGFDVRLADASHDLLDVFPGKRFDLIISVEVIEHVYDPLSLLKQARALLKPEGHLLLTTPYHGYLKNLLIAVAGRCDSHYNPLWDCGHIKFWSRKTLTTALKDAGFGDIRFCGAGRVPDLWRSMLLTARAIDAPHEPVGT
jgi:SAM-dependent methyltransferase